jgi:uncharacterized membrane protein YidH (DUF202 family)
MRVTFGLLSLGLAGLAIFSFVLLGAGGHKALGVHEQGDSFLAYLVMLYSVLASLALNYFYLQARKEPLLLTQSPLTIAINVVLAGVIYILVDTIHVDYTGIEDFDISVYVMIILPLLALAVLGYELDYKKRLKRGKASS